MRKLGVPNHGISAEDICDGNITMLLGMVWSMARHYQIDHDQSMPSSSSQATADSENKDQAQDKEAEAAKERERDEKAKQTLLGFLRRRTGMEVNDFRTGFSDGRLLCALVHSFDPLLADLAPPTVYQKSPLERLESAIELAEFRLNVPALLEPEDIANELVDPKSLMLYTSIFYNLEKEEERNKKRIEEEQGLMLLKKQEEERALMFKKQEEERLRREEEAKRREKEKIPETPAVPQPVEAHAPTDATHFPNKPLGGKFVDGYFVSSSHEGVGYQPMSASQHAKLTSFTWDKQGVRASPYSIVDRAKGFSYRVVLEAKHEAKRHSAQTTYTTYVDSSHFYRHFFFEKPELFYGEFACKFVSGGEHMMIGHLFITQNYLCFTGELHKVRISVILPLADIAHVEEGYVRFLERYKDVPTIIPKEKSAQNGPASAILVYDTRDNIHQFYSFIEPHKAHQTITNIWTWKWKKPTESSGFAGGHGYVPPLPDISLGPPPPLPKRPNQTGKPLSQH
jgi:hypothetical protein